MNQYNNNSNSSKDYQAAADTDTSHMGALHPNRPISGRVIRVEGDGRCLFRSLVTCLSSELQKARRDDFGCPLVKHDSNYETLMADALRSRVVKLMMDNAHFYGQLERTVINADQPVAGSYSHFQDRLQDMTLTSTMPGDLELNATCMAIEKQVMVVDVNLCPIVLYGRDHFPLSDAVVVRYTRLGSCVGHYDAVIPDPQSLEEMVVDQGQDLDSARPKKFDIKEKYDCFGNKLVSQSDYKGQTDKAIQATSQHEIPYDVSNNKSSKLSTATKKSDQGTSKNASVSDTRCRKCQGRSTSSDRLLDLLIKRIVFVPGKRKGAAKKSAVYKTKHNRVRKLAVRNRNKNRNSNKKPEKEDDVTARRNSRAAGRGKTSPKVKSDARSLAGKSKSRQKSLSRRRSRGKKKESDMKTDHMEFEVDLDKVPSDVLYYCAQQLADDDIVQDDYKKCLVCRLPVTSGKVIVKCGLCGRIAHPKCVQQRRSDLEVFYCSCCVSYFVSS